MTMKSVRCGRTLAWLVIGTVLGAAREDLAAQSEEPVRGVEQLLSYYLDGGGRWRQDNEDFAPGGDGPVYWVRVMEWGPKRDLVMADAFAVYESERCEAIVHMVYRWDSEQERVATLSFGAAGMLGVGFIEELGPNQSRVVGSVTLPNGSKSRFRDTSDLSRPGEYTTQADRWVDGEWVAAGGAHWRRDPKESPCG